MAVQKSRKTPSKRGMHRSHDALDASPRCRSIRSPVRPTCVIASLPDGFYRGKRVIEKPAEVETEE